jgi:hypothetical protein
MLSGARGGGQVNDEKDDEGQSPQVKRAIHALRRVQKRAEDLASAVRTGVLETRANGARPSGEGDHKEGGIKEDDLKTNWALLPVPFMTDVMDVFSYGARRRGRDQWREGIRFGRLFSAVCRHLFAWWRGEERELESGLSHLAHACCSLIFLGEMVRIRPDLDDRVKENQKEER